MKLRIVGLSLVAVLALGACSLIGQNQSQAKFKVGVILPLSGPVAQCGLNGQAGMELALDSLQARDKIELVYEDDKFIPKESVTAMQKFMGEGYNVVLGTCDSSGTLAMAPIAEENKKLMITPVAGADKISDAGDYVFRMTVKTSQEGNDMATFIKKQGYKRVAFFYMNNDYGKAYLDALSRNLSGSDTVVVYDAAMGVAATDVRTEILKAKQAKADVIVAAPTINQGIILLRQLAELGVDEPRVIGRSAEYKEVFDAVGSGLLEGVYFVSSVAGLNSRFLQEFKKLEDGMWPNDQLLGGYDTIYALNYALTQCGNDRPDCLKIALYNIKGAVASRGELKIDANGDSVLPMVVKQFRNGKFVGL